MNKNFAYTNRFVKIEQHPFWGEKITTISAPDILTADTIFAKNFPQHTKKGKINTGVSVSGHPPEIHSRKELTQRQRDCIFDYEEFFEVEVKEK